MDAAHDESCLGRLFKIMVERRASDLHLCCDSRPHVRVDGDMLELPDFPFVNAEQCREAILGIMPQRNREQFERDWDTDFGYEVDGLGRFRVNAFTDRHGPGAVFRLIPTRILTAEDLDLPQPVRDLCNLPKGLVVVTGPTGSGKSTTLAAMIDLINRTRAVHVITIEDPIEFVHQPKKSLINQREVGVHTRSFAQALRAALREDPDIVLVGEMRDLETTQIAIETAETGHLVFGTLHTTSAAETVERIINQFPADRQNQVRVLLANSLKAVIAQTLCRKRGGVGRVAALEVLLATSGISTNIREGKTHVIPSALQTGKSLGMQMLNDELAKLVLAQVIDPTEAYVKSVDRDDMLSRLQRAGISLDLEAGKASRATGAGAEAARRRERARDFVVKCRRDLAEQPNALGVINDLSWMLATNEDEEIRDGAEAVRLAEQAFKITLGQNPAVIDTLAAAYAEAGDCARAAATAKQGIELAAQEGQKELAAGMRERMACYQARQPLREPYEG